MAYCYRRKIKHNEAAILMFWKYAHQLASQAQARIVKPAAPTIRDIERLEKRWKIPEWYERKCKRWARDGRINSDGILGMRHGA